MATDMQRLLLGLRDYHTSLERHLLGLQQEFSALNSSWQRLSAVYEGAAATEYRAHWDCTRGRFEDYIHACHGINRLLMARIVSLEEAERTGGLG